MAKLNDRSKTHRSAASTTSLPLLEGRSAGEADECREGK
jgi:hypothetical protein